MPLIKSGSQEAVGLNIKREIESGRPPQQAKAIAMETQRRFGGGHVGVRPVGKRVGIRKPQHKIEQAPGK